jgi:hypothetical protein
MAPNSHPEEAVYCLFAISDALLEVPAILEDAHPGIALVLRTMGKQLRECADAIDSAHPAPIYDERGAA